MHSRNRGRMSAGAVAAATVFGGFIMIALYLGFRLAGPLLGYVQPAGFPLTQALFALGIVLFVAGGFTLTARALNRSGVTTLTLAGAAALLVGVGIPLLASGYSLDPVLDTLTVIVAVLSLGAGVLLLSTGVLRMRGHEEA